VLDLVTLLDSLLGDDLHRKHLAVLLVLGEHDLAEAALADHLEEVEVVQSDLVLLVRVAGAVLPVTLLLSLPLRVHKDELLHRGAQLHLRV